MQVQVKGMFDCVDKTTRNEQSKRREGKPVLNNVHLHRKALQRLIMEGAASWPGSS